MGVRRCLLRLEFAALMFNADRAKAKGCKDVAVQCIAEIYRVMDRLQRLDEADDQSPFTPPGRLASAHIWEGLDHGVCGWTASCTQVSDLDSVDGNDQLLMAGI